MTTPETPEVPTLPAELTAAARSARHVNVFTGAGMSADSGLDTFRDAQTGIWSRVDPQAMASISSWARDPEPMLAWYLWRAALCREAEPNAGHTAIGEWGRRGDVALEVTENLARVAAVAHERGEVSKGLRRGMVIQAIRLADLAAARLAQAEGRHRPSANAINMGELVGDVTGRSDQLQ